jgi:hypothetical protein
MAIVFERRSMSQHEVQDAIAASTATAEEALSGIRS